MKIHSLLLLILCIGYMKPLSAMANLGRVLGNLTRPAYSVENREPIEILNALRAIADNEEFLHAAVESMDTEQLEALINVINSQRLQWEYATIFKVLLDQRDNIKDEEQFIIGQQVEELTRAMEAPSMEAPSFVATIAALSPDMKNKFITYIEHFWQEYGFTDAYKELYQALKKPPQVQPVAGYYTTTEQHLIKTAGFPDLITHVINLNAIELSAPRCTVTTNVHLGPEDYAALIEAYGDLPEDLEDMFKPETITTLCGQPIVQRQAGNECGLMSIYNALQLYNLLSKTMNKQTFEAQLKQFNFDEWNADVASCPIDVSDIVNVIAKRIPMINNTQYTIIPTIVDDYNRLSYIPCKQKQIVALPDGTIQATFDQDMSLLQAIRNIHDVRVKNYTHMFFLNNLQIGAHGASMRHWIPVVLHKENGQIYLYTMNSQSVFYENLMDPAQKLINLTALEAVVEKDNAWVRALIQLLSLHQQALERALDIVHALPEHNDYNHDYVPDILHAIQGDNSIVARDIRLMFHQK